MINVFVCGSATWERFQETMVELQKYFGTLVLNGYGGSPVCAHARRWSRKSKTPYDELVLFGVTYDLVVAFGMATTPHTTEPLRQAWKKRTPALRIPEVGGAIYIGGGWGKLHPLFKKKRSL